MYPISAQIIPLLNTGRNSHYDPQLNSYFNELSVFPR